MNEVLIFFNLLPQPVKQQSSVQVSEVTLMKNGCVDFLYFCGLKKEERQIVTEFNELNKKVTNRRTLKVHVHSFAIVKLICLNRFVWTVLHVLRTRSLYPMYRQPFQTYSISMYTCIYMLLNSVIPIHVHVYTCNPKRT